MRLADFHYEGPSARSGNKGLNLLCLYYGAFYKCDYYYYYYYYRPIIYLSNNVVGVCEWQWSSCVRCSLTRSTKLSNLQRGAARLYLDEGVRGDVKRRRASNLRYTDFNTIPRHLRCKSSPPTLPGCHCGCSPCRFLASNADGLVMPIKA